MQINLGMMAELIITIYGNNHNITSFIYLFTLSLMIQSFGKYPVFPNTRKEFEEQFTEFEEKFIEKGKRLMMYGCSFNLEQWRAKNRRWPFFHKFNIQFTTLKSIILYDCKIINDVQLIDCRCIWCKFPPKNKWIKLWISIF